VFIGDRFLPGAQVGDSCSSLRLLVLLYEPLDVYHENQFPRCLRIGRMTYSKPADDFRVPASNHVSIGALKEAPRIIEMAQRPLRRIMLPAGIGAFLPTPFAGNTNIELFL
jgi:hypothetical protein